MAVLGSTLTPGPMVDATVTFLMNKPLAPDGRALRTALIRAPGSTLPHLRRKKAVKRIVVEKFADEDARCRVVHGIAARHVRL